jgi:hypothetical protein
VTPKLDLENDVSPEIGAVKVIGSSSSLALSSGFDLPSEDLINDKAVLDMCRREFSVDEKR